MRTRLSQRVKQLNLKQKTIAQALGISQSRLSLLAHGAQPSQPEVEKLTAWFNMPETELFARVEEGGSR